MMTSKIFVSGLAAVALLAAFVMTGRERDARADAIGKTMSIASDSSNGSSGATGGSVTVPIAPSAPAGAALKITGSP